MKEKNITYLRITLTFGLFMLLFSVIGLNKIQNNEISRSPSSAMEGSYIRTGKILYAQNLGGPSGLAIEGVNAIQGQTTTTDVLLAGTAGSGSIRGVMGYYANTSTALPLLLSDNDNMVTDMGKFVHDNGNQHVVYSERGSSDGAIACIRGTDLKYEDGVEVAPLWRSPKSGHPLESLTLGYFDNNDDIDVAAVSIQGMVYGMYDLNEIPDYPGILSGWHKDLLDAYTSDVRHVKNTIMAIDNLDAHGETWQDMIVGNYRNVTAISGDFGHSIIWTTQLAQVVASLQPLEDLNGDSKPEVAVSTFSTLYVLSGSDGEIIAELAPEGSHWRDIQVFEDINDDGIPEVITGNWDGDIIIWDVNPASATFNTTLLAIDNNGKSVFSILNVGDLTDDGFSEYAIGGGGRVGVILGNNGSWYWTGNPIGSGYWLAPRSINVYDLALLDDRDNDGYADIAVIGGYDTLESAMFIFSSQGQLEFRPVLHAGSVNLDTNCSTADHQFSYEIIVYQDQNVTSAVDIIIDETSYPMIKETSGDDWSSGIKFNYQTTLSEGDHTYKFHVTDDHGNEVFLPTSGVYYGPHVGDDCSSTDGTQNNTGFNIPGYSILWVLTLMGVTTIIKLRKH